MSVFEVRSSVNVGSLVKRRKGDLIHRIRMLQDALNFPREPTDSELRDETAHSLAYRIVALHRQFPED